MSLEQDMTSGEYAYYTVDCRYQIMPAAKP